MIRAYGLSWQGKLLLCSAAAVGIGLAAGLGFYSHTEELPLRFEQPEIDLRASPAIEGEDIEIVAKLHNFGKVPLTIAQTKSS
jgi:hypothetical protein